jgi:mitochondrial fission protein ELM1
VPLLRRRLHPERLGGQAVTFTRSEDAPRVVWRFSDGKPGHDNQSLGLTDALQRRLPLELYEVPVWPGQRSWFDWLSGHYPAGRLLPAPWLLVGAGHATQVPMLAARRARGGRAVVLMSPLLPGRLFDLCVIPAHDRPRPAANVIETRGGLNRVQAVTEGRHDSGLLLVGGPSRHYRWHTAEVIDQVARIIRYTPLRQWTLATSRRTPAGFAGQLRRFVFSATRSVRVVPWHETSPGWLQDQYRRADCAWVTEDSVSMLYEALTAGLPTGVLELPARRDGRVVRGVRQLVRMQQVTPFNEWIRGCPLRRPDRIYDEAGRCADWICTHWA